MARIGFALLLAAAAAGPPAAASPNPNDLPGWNQFKKAMPNSPAARELFAEMLADEANRAILTAVGGPPGELGQLVAHRKAEFSPARGGGPRGGAWGGRGGGREPTSTDLAALLFAES